MPDTNANIANANIAEQSAQVEASVPQEQSALAQFEVGTYVTFGRYPQNNGDTPEPIEWLVLDNDGQTALLFSKYGLDSQPFHQKDAGVNWRDCSLRQWLNRRFFSKAFDEAEQSLIEVSTIQTDDYLKHYEKLSAALGGKIGAADLDESFENGVQEYYETQDKVFCLSVREVLKYFGNEKESDGCKEVWYSAACESEERVNRELACKATAYALRRGADIPKRWKEYRKKNFEWWFDNANFWLRSPGYCGDCVYHGDYCGMHSAAVDQFGIIHGYNSNGYWMNNYCVAVRPALRVKLQWASAYNIFP